MEKDKLVIYSTTSRKHSEKIKTISGILTAIKKKEIFSFAAVKKNESEDVAILQISQSIAELCEMVNVKHSMTPKQIRFTAELILEKYYFLTRADLMLFVKNAILGYYGTIYNRLDPASILEFIKKYSDERMNEAESISIHEHESRKHQERKGLNARSGKTNRIDSIWAELERNEAEKRTSKK